MSQRKRAATKAARKRVQHNQALSGVPGLLDRLRKSKNPVAKLIAAAVVGFVAATGTGFAQETGKDIQDRTLPIEGSPADRPPPMYGSPPEGDPVPMTDPISGDHSTSPPDPFLSSPALSAVREELEESSDWALKQMAWGLDLEPAQPDTRRGLIDAMSKKVRMLDRFRVDYMARSAESRKELEAALLIMGVVESAEMRRAEPGDAERR